MRMIPVPSLHLKTNFADSTYNEKTLRLITQMHKAITIIQFKLEANIINRRPEFGMGGRKLLEKIDFERGVFVYEGKEYPLRDTNFPTVDPADPYRLTDEEQELIEKIHYSFMNSEKLKKHMQLPLYLWRYVSGVQFQFALSCLCASQRGWKFQAREYLR